MLAQPDPDAAGGGNVARRALFVVRAEAVGGRHDPLLRDEGGPAQAPRVHVDLPGPLVDLEFDFGSMLGCPGCTPTHTHTLAQTLTRIRTFTHTHTHTHTQLY